MTFKVIRGQVRQGEEMTSVPYRDYFYTMGPMARRVYSYAANVAFPLRPTLAAVETLLDNRNYCTDPNRILFIDEDRYSSSGRLVVTCRPGSKSAVNDYLVGVQ